MKHLDLFSGIGGFALAARNVGWETIGFCEIDPYCQKVLAKNFPGIRVFDDVRKLYRFATDMMPCTFLRMRLLRLLGV
jgi:DNA (cytosine-5)-methyltransferase 1